MTLLHATKLAVSIALTGKKKKQCIEDNKLVIQP